MSVDANDEEKLNIDQEKRCKLHLRRLTFIDTPLKQFRLLRCGTLKQLHMNGVAINSIYPVKEASSFISTSLPSPLIQSFLHLLQLMLLLLLKPRNRYLILFCAPFRRELSVNLFLAMV